MDVNADLDKKLEALVATVEQQTSVVDSAVQLITGIPALIQNAVTQAGHVSALTAQQQAVFANLSRRIQDSTQALAAAVQANTDQPADPSPVDPSPVDVPPDDSLPADPPADPPAAPAPDAPPAGPTP